MKTIILSNVDVWKSLKAADPKLATLFPDFEMRLKFGLKVTDEFNAMVETDTNLAGPVYEVVSREYKVALEKIRKILHAQLLVNELTGDQRPTPEEIKTLVEARSRVALDAAVEAMWNGVSGEIDEYLKSKNDKTKHVLNFTKEIVLSVGAVVLSAHAVAGSLAHLNIPLAVVSVLAGVKSVASAIVGVKEFCEEIETAEAGLRTQFVTLGTAYHEKISELERLARAGDQSEKKLEEVTEKLEEDEKAIRVLKSAMIVRTKEIQELKKESLALQAVLKKPGMKPADVAKKKKEAEDVKEELEKKEEELEKKETELEKLEKEAALLKKAVEAGRSNSAGVAMREISGAALNSVLGQSVVTTISTTKSSHEKYQGKLGQLRSKAGDTGKNIHSLLDAQGTLDTKLEQAVTIAMDNDRSAKNDQLVLRAQKAMEKSQTAVKADLALAEALEKRVEIARANDKEFEQRIQMFERLKTKVVENVESAVKIVTGLAQLCTGKVLDAHGSFAEMAKKAGEVWDLLDDAQSALESLNTVLE